MKVTVLGKTLVARWEFLCPVCDHKNEVDAINGETKGRKICWYCATALEWDSLAIEEDEEPNEQ